MQHGYKNEEDHKSHLIEKNLNLVKKISFYYAGKVGKAAEIEDLLQFGMVGLIEAAQKYTPKDNGTFSSYASLRIKGAIIDQLRKSSNLCRGTIKRKQDYNKAKRKLEVLLKRSPDPIEICRELQIDENTLAEWELDFAASQSQSVEEAIENHGDFLFSFDQSVEEKIYNDEMQSIMQNKISMLSKQQALVLQLYYVEELNVYEIAAVLSVTTGRVSQIKSSAVKQLREAIEKEVN